MTIRLKHINLSILFLILFLIFTSKTNGYCQVFNIHEQYTDNWGVGANVGLLHYISNVNSSSTNGIGLNISKAFSPVLGLRGDITMGYFHGQTEFYSFKGFLVETTLNGTVSLSKLVLGSESDKLINVYGLAGVGLSNFSGNSFDKSTGQLAREYGHGTGKGLFGYEMNGVFNTGIGVSYDILYNLKVTIESDIKFMQGAKLGDPYVSKIESYTYTSFGLVYQLPWVRKFHWKCL